MTWPTPQPGLVIRYSYLWQREALEGREEGVKDRACAVVVTSTDEDGRTRVFVLPIAHSLPADAATGVEIPPPVKLRLGPDGERSWVVVTEANDFAWPGPDLRFVPGHGPESTAFGFLPPGFFRVVRDRYLEANRQHKAARITRAE